MRDVPVVVDHFGEAPYVSQWQIERRRKVTKYNIQVRKTMDTHDCWNCPHFAACTRVKCRYDKEGTDV